MEKYDKKRIFKGHYLNQWNGMMHQDSACQKCSLHDLCENTADEKGLLNYGICMDEIEDKQYIYTHVGSFFKKIS